MRIFSLVLVVFTLLFIGFNAGRVVTKNETRRYTLRPYVGTASGVLTYGTILKENYLRPDSVIGHIDIEGIWVLEEVR